jgi:transposase
MTSYAGMDVSDKSVAINVCDREGVLIWRGECAAYPDVIASTLEQHAPDLERIVMETGPLATWLYHELAALDVPIICICARQAKKALSAANHKSDPNDAQGLADLCRNRYYKEVRVKQDITHVARVDLKVLGLLNTQYVAVRNSLRGMLKQFGLRLGVVNTPNKLEERLEHLFRQRPDVKPMMEPLLAMARALAAELKKLHARLDATAAANPVTARMMTVPGVGPVTSLVFMTSVEDPTRFKRGREAPAFAGLVPRRIQSGNVDILGSITKTGDRMLRSALYEAAHILISRVKKPCALQTWGRGIAERRGGKRARVAVARKLAILLHRMWRDETDFRWDDNDAGNAKENGADS